MVCFNRCRRPLYGYRLDYVRIEGSLHQVSNLPVRFPRLELLCFFRKDGNELSTDALALFLGVRNPFQLSKKAFRSIHADHVEFQSIAQHLQRLFKFVLPQHPRIYEDVRQPGTHRPWNQHSRYGGIDSAAQPANGPLISHLLADRSGGLLDKGSTAPPRLRFTYVEQKVPQQFGPMVRVIHFRVELDRINLLLQILDGADGIFCPRSGTKSFRERSNVIAVAVPYAQ